jgi:cytochrome c oxidase assembly protein subunit 15
VAHRLALATGAATLVLIVAGGLVTNTGSALAVPDWPTTFGHNMFLYPWSEMVGGIFYEHSHRLLGAVVGLLTLALAGVLWPAGGPLRVLGLVAVAGVVAQGVVGGLRVVLREDSLAVVHGSLAQAFWGLVVVIAVLAAPRPTGPSTPEPPSPSLRALTLVAAGLVYLQIVFGATLTHAGRLDLHLGGAVAVFVVVPVVTARVRRAGAPFDRTIARALLVLLGLQLVLGIGSFLARFSSLPLPGGPVTGLILPVVHRLTGSLVLGAAVALAVRIGLGAHVVGLRHPAELGRRVVA